MNIFCSEDIKDPGSGMVTLYGSPAPCDHKDMTYSNPIPKYHHGEYQERESKMEGVNI